MIKVNEIKKNNKTYDFGVVYIPLPTIFSTKIPRQFILRESCTCLAQMLHW